MKKFATAGLLCLCLAVVASDVPGEKSPKLCGAEFREAFAKACGTAVLYDPHKGLEEDKTASKRKWDASRQQKLDELISNLCCNTGCTENDLKLLCRYPVPE